MCSHYTLWLSVFLSDLSERNFIIEFVLFCFLLFIGKGCICLHFCILNTEVFNIKCCLLHQNYCVIYITNSWAYLVYIKALNLSSVVWFCYADLYDLQYCSFLGWYWNKLCVQWDVCGKLDVLLSSVLIRTNNWSGDMSTFGLVILCIS